MTSSQLLTLIELRLQDAKYTELAAQSLSSVSEVEQDRQGKPDIFARCRTETWVSAYGMLSKDKPWYSSALDFWMPDNGRHQNVESVHPQSGCGNGLRCRLQATFFITSASSLPLVGLRLCSHRTLSPIIVSNQATPGRSFLPDTAAGSQISIFGCISRVYLGLGTLSAL
ncbi:uncharacterized protein BDV17DRAFT_249434 [Aspergillus undulatus]|uniref:uncharacterized protein n=1 Tax=Aspergillus undulatus TaxID=1810928 RepID=UPI003CCCF10C